MKKSFFFPGKTILLYTDPYLSILLYVSYTRTFIELHVIATIMMVVLVDFPFFIVRHFCCNERKRPIKEKLGHSKCWVILMLSRTRTHTHTDKMERRFFLCSTIFCVAIARSTRSMSHTHAQHTSVFILSRQQ